MGDGKGNAIARAMELVATLTDLKDDFNFFTI